MQYTQEQLAEIIAKHNQWFKGEQGGERANLIGANLRGADLIGADLIDANLIDADLRGANLEGAGLRGADLIGANLEGADLRGANLIGANLEDADLIDANLEGAIKIPMHCRWSFGITEGLIHIGCEKRSIEQWDVFFASTDVITTSRDTQKFKQIEAVYKGLRAYYLHLNS